MRWGVIFAFGWVAATAYYRVEHLWTQRAVLVSQKSVLAKQAACEHARADTNEIIAEEALEGARPLPTDVAPDCKHPTIK